MSESERANTLYQLDKRVDEGLLRKSRHPKLDLTVYSYTDFCTWKGKWDKWTMLSRGLVINDAGYQVGRGPLKFWNLEEPACPELPSSKIPFEVYEKIDGSAFFSTMYEHERIFWTRGSFDNQFVDYGRKFASYLDHFPHNHSIFMEVCMPEDVDGLPRCVHHEPGLYLLAAIDNYSGKDFPLKSIKDGWRGFLPKTFTGTLDELSKQARELEATEGFVVRWPSGFRVKIKTAWYFRLFRSIFKLDEKIKDGILHELSLEEIQKGLPEELKDVSKEIYAQIRFEAKKLEYELYGLMINKWDPDKQVFLDRIKDLPNKDLILQLYLDRPIWHCLVDMVEIDRTAITMPLRRQEKIV